MPMIEVSTQVALDSELSERLKRISQRRSLSVDGLMVEAIRQFVEHAEEEALLQDETRERWERYQAEGGVVSDDEVNVWLDGWGTQGEKASPV